MTSEIHKALIRVKLETLFQLQLGLAQRIGKERPIGQTPEVVEDLPTA